MVIGGRDESRIDPALHTFRTLVQLPLSLAERVWLLEQLHREAGRTVPTPEMLRAIVQLGPVRSLKRLSRVRGFGRRRRTHLRHVLNHAWLEDVLSTLLHTLTDTPPDTPPVVDQHPLGPDAGFPPVVALRLLAVPPLAPPPPRPGFPLGHPRVTDFLGALKRPSLPQRLILLGGGYAGTELAIHWRSRGHEVTVVHLRRHLLAGHLPPIAEAIHDEAVAAGVVVITDAEPVQLSERGGGVVVAVSTWDGTVLVTGDLIVITE